VAGSVAEFYAATYPRLVGVLTVASGSRPDAEEVVQEAFVRLVTRWDTVSRYEDPESWVRSVAFRLAYSRWRRAGRGGPAPDPVEVDRVLAALPRNRRAVLVLRHAAGLPVERIAAELDVAAGTVTSRLAPNGHEVPEGLDALVRGAVERETFATVTPPFDLLAFRGRHRRVRQAFVGAVATAAVLATVAVAVPRLGNGGGRGERLGPVPSPAVELRPFLDISGDPVARVRVGSCMADAGYDPLPESFWGLDAPLPESEVPGQPRGSGRFGEFYTSCLAMAGYDAPPAIVPIGDAAACGDFAGRPPAGPQIAAGSGGGHRWAGYAPAAAEGPCLTFAVDDAAILEVAGMAPGGDGVEFHLAPFGDAVGTGLWVALSFVPADVAHVVLDADGVTFEADTYPVPDETHRTLVAVATLDGPVDVVKGTYEDGEGNVVGHLPPQRLTS
jgi:DNA-directed RNA polymerase specialized sigma24 family protein